jgi:hypothetical protein
MDKRLSRSEHPDFAKSKNIKLQIHHSSRHNAVVTFEKYFQLSTLAPEFFSLLPICLTADSTAGEPMGHGCNF